VVLAVFGRNAISPRRGRLIYRTVNSPMPHSARYATTPDLTFVFGFLTAAGFEDGNFGAVFLGVPALGTAARVAATDSPAGPLPSPRTSTAEEVQSAERMTRLISRLT